MADFPPTHPGEVLREDFLKPMGLSQYELAKSISVPQIRISGIVRGKRAVTPDTALRLARYFGTSAEFWLGMQTTYDLEVARDLHGSRIDAAVRPRAETAHSAGPGRGSTPVGSTRQRGMKPKVARANPRHKGIARAPNKDAVAALRAGRRVTRQP